MNLQLALNNLALTLLPDGTVSGTTPPGTWQTQSASRTNSLSLAVAGATPGTLAVNYTINASNQVEIGIPVQPGVTTAVAPVAFNGRIEIDDNRDLVYVCTDDDMNDTGLRLYVYGDLSFDQAANKLLLTPAGAAAPSAITGKKPGSNVLVGKQNITSGGQLQPIDQLRFAATTTNTTAAGTYTMDASIQFLGNWNYVNNQLQFRATLDQQPGGPPAISIGFAGKCGATNAGLVYYSDAAGTVAAFTVAGQIACNNTTGNWELNLGYTTKLTGKLAVNTSTTTANGGKLTLSGALTFDSGSNLTLNLAVDYQWSGNQLSFTVNNTAGGYELSLSGTFKIASGNVDFAIAYNPNDPTKTLSLSLGNMNSDSALKGSLQAIVGKKGLTLTANMSFGVQWVNGVMVPV